jgi:hypothetical protein
MSVYKYEDLLDKDDQMKALGWDEVYHQAIHFPEQVLQAYRTDTKVKLSTSTPQRITICQANGENDLLILLVVINFHDKLDITIINELPSEWHPDNGLLFIPDFDNQLKQIPDAEGIIYLSSRSDDFSSAISKCINFENIPANEGLGMFLGFIYRYLDDLYGFDSSSEINKIVGADMQKAGVIAWRQPLKNNFAKSWAIRISKNETCRILSTQSHYSVICDYWQKKLQSWSAILPGDDKHIYLEEMMPAPKTPAKPAGAEIIFADGDDLLSQLISLHYLANGIAIYAAIIKQVKYKEDNYEL